MKNILFFIVLVVSLVLDATVFRMPGISAFAPNLVVLGIVMVAILRGSRMGMIFGALIGLMQDVSFGPFLGQTAFAYALVGYLSGYFRSLVMRESLLLALLLSGVSAEVSTWIVYGVSRLFAAAPTSLHLILRESSRSALMTMIACVILYRIYRLVFLVKPKVKYHSDSAGV
ncbi:rod shape-determining protein MreD [Sulfoacidibacillus thermotolerans]|uniref:Rod shape-determining protein MreD n=1 Tax=Sulfoacidibacillus thermotolerans TaxID=1765684 RepID=A0A2U3DC55_SULT2|nr:rod shape-determining protein MreD [Sulfoacidibacillus thermotolerans]PWI58825.1 rod shape-determining protein MreD [Sulfoacidibacillus thermotolerans]